jgi:hypothetical protein
MEQPTPPKPPPATMMDLLCGRWLSQAIGAGARLGLADRLAAGPQAVPDLARSTGCHAGSLYRLLRALASHGIFAEDAGGRFSNTPLSETLRTDVPGSMHGMACYLGDRAPVIAWAEMEYSLRSGKPAFEHVHGKQAFEYLAEHTELGDHFNRAMTGFSMQIGEVVAECYEFDRIGTLADVGGGYGTVLSIVLRRHPGLCGVLFDLPHVVASAGPLLERMGVAERVKLVGGDFLKSVPVQADAYLLKHILHDWNDDDAARILTNIRRGSGPGARLLLLEAVIEPGNAPQFAKLLDLEMLAITHGGRERTEREWNELLARGGFRLTRVVPTPSPVCVIEAVPT